MASYPDYLLHVTRLSWPNPVSQFCLIFSMKLGIHVKGKSNQLSNCLLMKECQKPLSSTPLFHLSPSLCLSSPTIIPLTVHKGPFCVEDHQTHGLERRIAGQCSGGGQKILHNPVCWLGKWAQEPWKTASQMVNSASIPTLQVSPIWLMVLFFWFGGSHKVQRDATVKHCCW